MNGVLKQILCLFGFVFAVVEAAGRGTNEPLTPGYHGFPARDSQVGICCVRWGVCMCVCSF
ncbi:Hypothetical predicted protein [Lynx pardinus]|uniref:Secreted protein n=1 Tax=Lynx pardinus TaxID=191816 RepID=A0A485MK22_LYNPA|nr:Hypothetical predicted protein [Lynx pardinus]